MSALRALIAAKLPGQRFALFFNTDEDGGESSGFVVDDQGRHWAYWTETVDGRSWTTLILPCRHAGWRHDQDTRAFRSWRHRFDRQDWPQVCGVRSPVCRNASNGLPHTTQT